MPSLGRVSATAPEGEPIQSPAHALNFKDGAEGLRRPKHLDRVDPCHQPSITERRELPRTVQEACPEHLAETGQFRQVRVTSKAGEIATTHQTKL